MYVESVLTLRWLIWTKSVMFKDHYVPRFPYGKEIPSGLHQHARAPATTLVNKDPKYACPNRKSKTMAVGRPYMIENSDSKDYGKYVTPMFSYTCKEMPMTRQMSRPMNMLDLGFCLETWMDAWPWSTEVSRQKPPNFIQVCVSLAGNVADMSVTCLLSRHFLRFWGWHLKCRDIVTGFVSESRVSACQWRHIIAH
jgi:hypothetical protein